MENIQQKPEQKVIFVPRCIPIEEQLNNISDKLDYLISRINEKK